MDIDNQKCPNCGGNLETDVNHMKKICPYCEAEFFIESSKESVCFTNNNDDIEKEQKKGKYSLILTSTGGDKVKAIKVYRQITGEGLREAKDKIDNLPLILFNYIDKSEAERYIELFRKESSRIQFVIE